MSERREALRDALAGIYRSRDMLSGLNWRVQQRIIDEDAATLRRALAAAPLAGEGLCLAVSNSGPNGEPLACAYPRNTPGERMHEHSWATLPTFTEGDGAPEARTAEWLIRRHKGVGGGDRLALWQLHQRGPGDREDDPEDGRCTSCLVLWPCPTAAVLEANQPVAEERT